MHERAYVVEHTLHLIDKNKTIDISVPGINIGGVTDRGGSSDRHIVKNNRRKGDDSNNLSIIENHYDKNNNIFGNNFNDNIENASLSPEKKLKFEDRDRSRVSNYKDTVESEEC